MRRSCVSRARCRGERCEMSLQQYALFTLQLSIVCLGFSSELKSAGWPRSPEALDQHQVVDGRIQARVENCAAVARGGEADPSVAQPAGYCGGSALSNVKKPLFRRAACATCRERSGASARTSIPWELRKIHQCFTSPASRSVRHGKTLEERRSHACQDERALHSIE